MKRSKDTAKPSCVDELRLAQKRLAFYRENTSIGFIEWDDQLHVKSWSKRAEAIFGWKEQEFIKMHKDGYSHVFEDDLPAAKIIATQLFTGVVETNNLQHRNYTKDGRIIWCEWFNSVLKNQDGRVISVISQVQDVTAQRKAAEKFVARSHLYAFITQVNQTITRFKDEQTVLKEACNIACEFGKLKAAWVGEIDEGSNSVNLLYHCGLSAENISILKTVLYESNDMVDQLIKTGNSIFSNDIETDCRFAKWQGWAAESGWASCMVLPVKKSKRVVAILHLVSAEIDFFAPEVVALIKEAAGDISSALAIFEEEKHTKRMIDQALHNALRLEQAQAIAHVGSWELDFSTGILIWSKEGRRIYGLSPEDNVHSYESWLSHIHPDDLAYVLTVTKAAEGTLTSAAFFHRIVRDDGVIRDLYSRAEFEFDAEGKPIGLYGIAHDITEIKAGEKALAQSEANLRQMIDLLPQSIFARNTLGNYLFVNKSFADLNECGPGDLTGQSLTKTIPASRDATYFLKQDEAVIASGESQIIAEYPFTDRHEHARLFRIEKFPYTVAGSNEKAVLGMIVDITEQKRLDADGAKMTADIVQRNADLEQFAYVISHNLRSPVANIRGITDLLRTNDLEPLESKELMDRLSISIKNLDSVILDLNYILEARHKDQKPKEWVKLSDLVTDISFSMASAIRASAAVIISDFSATDDTLTIKTYLYSIFINLIANSIKYCQAGVSPVIHISSELLNGHLQLIFTDNGIGIDLAKYGGQVFGLYKRFHGHVAGKGLGLYLVKTEVELLGGKITVKSDVSKGTEFRIEFQE